ncbi:MAG: PepSY-like domain-containing protein, partial [Tannerellaceae bacterium]|nr:PepSY-like domain-containing protein [Tannerellaceae bacterium]
MKKIGFLILSLFITIGIAYADNDKITTDVNELPAGSREFIARWFTDTNIAHIKIEQNLMGTKGYEVLLTNGIDLEFNREGEWTEIDGNGALLPEEILPSGITSQLRTNYPGHSILKMEKKRNNHWEVKLTNQLELTFDQAGRLVDIDN